MTEPLIEQECMEETVTETPAVPDWRAMLRRGDRSGHRAGQRPLVAGVDGRRLDPSPRIRHLPHSAQPGQGSDPRHILVWFIELVAVFVAMRIFAGKGWFWSPQAIHFVGRLWLTLLILSFSLSTLNATIGWETLWFKAAWGTLSSFFFATLAWLITPRFLILAVQMYVTALLMARFMEWNNLIYGVSWWLALMEVAWVVRRRERKWTAQSLDRDRSHDDAASR